MFRNAYFYEPAFDAFFKPFFISSDSHCSVQCGNDSLTSVLRPKMDVHESKEAGEMTVTFELPGLKKEDICIDVHNNRLVVSGQSTISNDLNDNGYTVRERRYGRFSRALTLPDGIKAEDIKASMENGVLTVRYPKSYPDQEPKKITIS